MICDCWLITDNFRFAVEEEHPSLRHLLRKDQVAASNSTLLCGAKHTRSDGTSRKCIYWEFRTSYDIKVCRLCEVAVENGSVKVEDIC